MATLSWRQIPTPSTDGTGDESVLIWAVDSQGELIAGKVARVAIPASAMQEALAAGSVGAVVSALKALLEARLKVKDWDKAALDALEAANAQAAQASADFETWRADELEQEYPIAFNL